ncbi:MAG: PQQ-binding-like beta-propeller repeat protein [Planctomycetes bacterium]|nr:PQQ-binding-like beta-propeller repeat protein [Planctomycetota bacterium]
MQVPSNAFRFHLRARCIRATAFALIACVAPAIGRAQGPAWPMYQANAQHTGFTPVAINPASINFRWTSPVSHVALNSVTAADGKIFATDGDKLYAVNAATGAVLWNLDFSTAFSVNAPSYDGGVVYLQTCNHASDTYLRAYRADTGALVFRAAHAAQWESYLAPTIVDGKVYVNGGYYGGMYAFDAVTGTQLWFHALPQYDEWTPAVDQTRAYAYVGGTLYVIDRITGQDVFSIPDPHFDWEGWSMYLAPVLGPMNDVVVAHDGRLLSFDLEQRDIRWEVADHFSGQVAIANGVVYAIDGGALTARSEETGDLLWSWEVTTGSLLGTILLTQSHAFVRTSTATFAVDLDTHLQAWTYAASGPLTLSESVLYIARSDGSLTALAVRLRPDLSAIEPSRAHYALGPAPVTIHGAAFLQGGAVTVRFGDASATDVVVDDDATIHCTTPAGAPGRVDVTVENENGQGVLRQSFTYTPAMIAGGTQRRGGTLEASYLCDEDDAIIAFWGRAPRLDRTMPPFAGMECISPAKRLFVIPRWFSNEFRFFMNIPNRPRYSGHFLLQALVGSGLGHGEGAFTNCIEVDIP